MKPNPSKPKAVERLIKKLGFAESGGSGSHRVYKHRDGRRTTIAFHAKDIKTGTLRQIISDVGLTVEEFNAKI